jgi:hypothetical protein
MDNSFKKSNFPLWVKIAIYASKNEKIHSIKSNGNWESRKMKKFHDMKLDGYLTVENSFWNKESFLFTPTEKFKKEFKEKYCEISKKIRPDFTDEIRNQMLAAFKF